MLRDQIVEAQDFEPEKQEKTFAERKYAWNTDAQDIEKVLTQPDDICIGMPRVRQRWDHQDTFFPASIVTNFMMGPEVMLVPQPRPGEHAET